MLKTKVKASSITNLTDARYFSAWLLDWLGFDLRQGSSTYVQPQLVHAIKGWVDGVDIVGEFDLEPASEILTTAEMLGLNAVQLGMYSTQETAIEVQAKYPILKEIIIEASSDLQNIESLLEAFSPYTMAFIIDFEKNGITWEILNKNTSIDKGVLGKFCENYPVLLNFPWSDAQEVEEILSTLQPLGIILKGGEEEKVGYKSFDELDDIFDALQED